MGKIIELPRDFEEEPDEKKKKFFIKLKKVVAIISTICGITGLTAWGLINLAFEKDWQTIAEEYNNEGLDLYNSGEYEKAIELYEKAIALEEKGIDDIEVCYFNRGRAYYKLGDYEKAIGDYTIAIDINPKAEYYSQRALAYGMIGDTANETLDNLRAIGSSL